MGRLILLRHGESFKNLEARHGAVDSSITAEGRAQVRQAATQLSELLGLMPCAMWTVARRHCLETAALLHELLPWNEWQMFEAPIKPYFMGDLDGLSDGEVQERYPDVARRLNLYRTGHLDIGEVNIPGAVDAGTFFEDATRALNAIRKEENSLVVGTRSVLVGLFNIIRGKHPRPGGGYREVPWDNCGYCVFGNQLEIISSSGVRTEIGDIGW